ncbi:hypothetical protein M8C21_018959, partial [Ambrosia artemisiifolia]
IFDKLCQNFGGDVLQTLFNTADGLANCSPESEHMRYWQWRFICDEVLAVASSNILFHEIEKIKSNVFKRFSKDNIQSLNILEAEGPWFENFLYTLNIEPENPKKNLTFVPLAPASVS